MKTFELTKGEKTKRNIFDVSVQLFKTYGYDKVTISEITNACNVSKGTFYTHFTTKADILAIQFDVIDEMYDMYYNKHHYKGFDALENFMKYVFYVVENVVGKEILRNIYAERLVNGTLKTLTRSDRNLFLVLRSIVNCEEMKDFDVNETVNSANMLIRGVCYEWACSEENESIESFYNFLLDSYITGLKAKVTKKI